MAWYRLYRPKRIQELSITSVREALERMMQNGKIPQALLFAGPKGTGKTSASRILGAMLNDPANADLIDHLFFHKSAPQKMIFQEPDVSSAFAQRGYEGHSFVVQELDAASNRRIDDIRLLREKINLPPAEGKMMVYILDEVHMLTTEAFNALLKILEEPPSHVVFILATTELHKIPATIVSRCSVINFRKANLDEIKQALKRVLEAEKIKFNDDDLTKIALRADGSLRDGVKILEMACQNDRLELALIKDLLASDNENHIRNLLDSVMQKNEQALASIFAELRNNNYNQRDFYKDLFEFLHKDLLLNLAVIKGTACYALKVDQFFLKELLTIDLYQETPIAFLVLELKFLEIIERSKKTGGEDPASANISKTSPKPISQKTIPSLTKQAVADENKKKIQKPEIELEPNIVWQKLIQFFAPNNFSLLTLLKSCKLNNLSAGIAQVFVYYAFHKEQLEQRKNLDLLRQATRELLGTELQFNFVLQEAVKPAEFAASETDLLLAAKNSLL
jgi:DNA polymerase-3 subunit gamma/tau